MLLSKLRRFSSRDMGCFYSILSSKSWMQYKWNRICHLLTRTLEYFLAHEQKHRAYNIWHRLRTLHLCFVFVLIIGVSLFGEGGGGGLYSFFVLSKTLVILRFRAKRTLFFAGLS